MRRIATWLTASLTVGILGGTLPANAAAFLAINGGNWSYSAALASSPVGTAYYWGLSIGVGSYSYAYAYSFDPPFGSAAAYAIARAGSGWRGAWYAAGFADPQADIGIGIPDIGPIGLPTLVANGDSTDLGTEVTADVANATPGYTLNTSGGNITSITFNNISNDTTSSEINAIDEYAILVLNTNTDTDGGLNEFCNAVDGGNASNCENGLSGQTTNTGNVTNINQLVNDFPANSFFDVFFDINPGNLSSDGTFIFPTPIPGNSQFLLVAAGDPLPEPASILLIAPGLLSLGLFAWRRRRNVA